MPQDVGVLTYLLMQFSGLFSHGIANLAPTANWLLATLAAIDITLAGLWLALGAGDMNRTFLKKVLVIGFYVFVISTFPTLVESVRDGFIYAGLKAGGDSFTVADITDPSKIAGYGAAVMTKLASKISVFSPAEGATYLVFGLMIMLSFFVVAIQVFITIMEFYIIATIGLILVPFGIFKHTSFLAEKTFGAIISFGIKLMVLAFILSITMPVMSNLTNIPDPAYKEIMAMLLAGLAIAFLSWQAPGLAAGLLAGSPSLSAGSAAGFAVAGAAAGGAMGYAASQGVSTLGNVGKSVASTGVGATKTAVAGASAMHTLYREGGGDKAGWEGLSAGVANIGYGVTGGAAKLASRTVANAVQSAYAPAVERGKEFGSKLSSTPGGDSQLPTGVPTSHKGKPEDKGRGVGQGIKNTLAGLQRAIPPEASPQGSNSTPLKHHEDV